MIQLQLLALAFPSLLPAPAQDPGDGSWQVPSRDGSPSVLVIEGGRARQVVGGLEVAAGPGGSALLSGACGTVADSFLGTGAAPEGDVPTAVAFTPDGARFVVAHMASGNLTVFDAATQAVLGTVALSGSSAHVAVSSDNVH